MCIYACVYVRTGVHIRLRVHDMFTHVCVRMYIQNVTKAQTYGCMYMCIPAETPAMLRCWCGW